MENGGWRYAFPPQDAYDILRALDLFKKMKFALPDYTQETPLKVPRKFTIQTGYWPITVAVGGNDKAWMDTNIVVWFTNNAPQHMRISSTCRNGRDSTNAPHDFLTHPNRRKNWRHPCGTCRKCIAARFVQEVYNKWLLENKRGAKNPPVVPLTVEGTWPPEPRDEQAQEITDAINLGAAGRDR